MVEDSLEDSSPGIQILALCLNWLLNFPEPLIPICKIGMMFHSQGCLEESVYLALTHFICYD